ncbi:MAG: hypothetical protein J3R72DRAFT_452725 [Linnemannia gamsii]|nr:MAG: hypothetical protein J3R72DRAFT_452725 [Linnemannia gamsii]
MDFTIPRSSSTILLVGHAGIGKRRLASFIRSKIAVPTVTTDDAHSFDRSSTSNTNVMFRTAETLPRVIGQADGQSSLLSVLKGADSNATTGAYDQATVVDSVARYDLILFVVDMANQDSWDDCKRSLLRLDPGWFLGRCAIVVTEVANVSKYAFDRDEIMDYLERFYNIPTVWTNLNSTFEATLAATQIIRLLEIASGYRRQDRDYSLAGLSQATAASLPARSPLTAFSSTASLSGLYLGSNLGGRITTTPSLVRTPIPYRTPMTVLGNDSDQEMAAAQDDKADDKRLRGTLEDEDA